jgi:hypothetical protein
MASTRVHSAMGHEGRQAGPGCQVLLPVNFELYRRYSRLFKDTVREITPSSKMRHR